MDEGTDLSQSITLESNTQPYDESEDFEFEKEDAMKKRKKDLDISKDKSYESS